ncbi:hypothetical protein P3T65_26415 [Pseudomonas nitroreducens]|uniref:hypothetical protein n=1 Tax=Pseudomonas nitroreducens TaxID=46680 RepID=UPI0023FA3618|nr:hypothetical protein [Pseudomonas nitroreducens]WEW97722.1 hypothetical protein P3T65_26415 [Pseudomonas nitroreducens]
MDYKNLSAAEVAKVQHQESVVLLALQTLNSMRMALDLAPVHLDLKQAAGEALVVAGVDVQATAELAHLHAYKLEQDARLLLGKAAELRRSARVAIHLEFQEDGLVVVSGWAGGRRDSSYAPRPLDAAVQVISHLAQELREQVPHPHPDKGAH